MSINTNMRLTVLASAFALIIAAPAAIAQSSGTWYGDIHTDPVTNEGVSLRHSKALMEQKIAPSTAAGNPVEKSTQLTDGSTVHVFADGKMAMEDRFGRAAYMEPGHAMQTRDGKTVVMNGNEVARLDQLLILSRTGG